MALALEVAADAVDASGRDPAELASVFASTHGDLAINDAMCSTLVDAPTLLSPTKFHNSVHNAAAGYWTIATGCMQPSTALTAYDASFAAGLLEAATQCAADRRPVLLVAYDIAAVGALASVVRSDGQLAVALVLAPAGEGGSAESATAPPMSTTVELALVSTPSPAAPRRRRSAAAAALAGNAMAGALPFFEALALESAEPFDLPLSATLSLRVMLRLTPSAPLPAQTP